MINKTTHEADFDEEATYPSYMVYRGTTVVDGHATVGISEVGDQTEYGKVAHEATKMSGEETPLNKQLDGLAKLIGVIGFLLAVMTFLALFIKGIHNGDTHFTTIQKFTTSLVILSMMVALVKVWVPIVYDGIALFKSDSKNSGTGSRGQLDQMDPDWICHLSDCWQESPILLASTLPCPKHGSTWLLPARFSPILWSPLP